MKQAKKTTQSVLAYVLDRTLRLIASVHAVHDARKSGSICPMKGRRLPSRLGRSL